MELNILDGMRNERVVQYEYIQNAIMRKENETRCKKKESMNER